jgi:hypothetical protein
MAGLPIVVSAELGQSAARPTWQPNCDERGVLHPGCEYEAKQFLSAEEQRQFQMLYPRFGNVEGKKDSKQKGNADGFRKPTRNRENTAGEYAANDLPEGEGKPTAEQLTFRRTVETEFAQPTLRMTRRTLKIELPVDKAAIDLWLPDERPSKIPYGDSVAIRNALAKLTRIGLRWATR